MVGILYITQQAADSKGMVMMRVTKMEADYCASCCVSCLVYWYTIADRIYHALFRQMPFPHMR